MSRLTDLLRQLRSADPQLGADLEKEITALTKRRSFGLVFERHQPEAVELPGQPVRRGSKVQVLPPRGETAKGDARNPGTTVVLYSSSPEKAVLGTVRLRRTIKVNPDCVWGLHGSDIGISESDLNAYLEGADESTLLEVDCPDSWEQPVPLNSLRTVLGIEPSQSFRYLATEQVEQAKQLSAPDV
ncbi:hypothetical protein [Gulosibacter molinativorax]|uniref:hypothetical protein n=1 Tax=Gulosibacter molinativorax TaxID=256821 RepID=UPI000414B381|nr:hypothetical protein [Gulosibacter molinativorax]QUY62296.1 DNA methyltransferase [Gulosibacter molinativorax]